MDSASLSSLLKRLCKVMWEANVTNPITYVTQISFLIFLKMLEEMEVEQGGKNPLFTKVTVDGQEVDFTRLRWSTLTTDPDNDRMLRTLRDLLPRLTFHPDLSIAARALFEDAAIVIPDGATLRRAVDIISPIHFLSEDADVKGDLFEILVNDLGSQKKAAQFRTPRHLIRVIVEMVNPQIGETMCDSAGGTGGFGIAVYDHILLANTSPQFVREVPAPHGQTVKRGLGDKLTPLGRCGKILGGGTPAKDNSSFWNGNIPWITAKEMWNHEIHDSQLKISEEALKASATKLIPANSVLFVVRGSILFKRVPVAINRMPCTINQDMKAIVPHEDILADYLAHMMWGSNEELRGLVDTAGNSAGKLETDKWSAVEIPIPESKAEQRQIIAKLDVLNKKHAELRRLQVEAETELAAFTPALLAKAFRGDL
jgi:Type I restriction modification DNA specificity domain/N-6 DNA Methylase/HsdM N-terminal domain